ncbi:nucleoside deaminase [Magnetovibrio sp. PR-2]|uniref:nucleoside deaminase n=1 Tax=Magnetovibrio sp. PR-2 TaxID=3120356 RepID=UPI003FA5F265
MSEANDTPMQLALTLARAGADAGEVPVGCVIVDGETGEVLAQTTNRTERDHDPTAHAELLAIREACAKVGSTRLVGCDLYVTLEPCAMCATAISYARIRRLYFGAYDPKMGGVEHGPAIFNQPTCHHSPEVYGGMDESEAVEMLKTFFSKRR